MDGMDVMDRMDGAGEGRPAVGAGAGSGDPRTAGGSSAALESSATGGSGDGAPRTEKEAARELQRALMVAPDTAALCLAAWFAEGGGTWEERYVHVPGKPGRFMVQVGPLEEMKWCNPGAVSALRDQVGGVAAGNRALLEEVARLRASQEGMVRPEAFAAVVAERDGLRRRMNRAADLQECGEESVVHEETLLRQGQDSEELVVLYPAEWTLRPGHDCDRMGCGVRHVLLRGVA